MLTFLCVLILRCSSCQYALACARSEDLAFSSTGTENTFQVLTRTAPGPVYISVYRVLIEQMILSSTWTGFLENHQINAHTGGLELA